MSAIRLERIVYAPRDWVVHAWCDPAVLAEWFCPNPSTTVMAELNLDSGGLWKVTMGQVAVRGQYVEVQLPQRLAFTWQWEHEPDLPPSLVRVTFTERSPDSTEVLLEHVDFQDQHEATSHEQGWAITLDRLAQVAPAKMAASS